MYSQAFWPIFVGYILYTVVRMHCNCVYIVTAPHDHSLMFCREVHHGDSDQGEEEWSQEGQAW